MGCSPVSADDFIIFKQTICGVYPGVASQGLRFPNNLYIAMFIVTVWYQTPAAVGISR